MGKIVEWLLALLAALFILWWLIEGKDFTSGNPVPCLGVASVIYLLLRYLLPAVMFGGGVFSASEERVRLVREIANSGKPLADHISGGMVGGMGIRGPLMSVSIFPGGITITMVLGPATAIRVEEIEKVIYGRYFLAEGVWIEHRAPFVAGTLFLTGVKRHSQFALALNELVRPERVTQK